MREFPNKKNKYGVCDKCSGVNLQKTCTGCGREPSSTKCADCNKHIGGGFKFSEIHRSGHRCYECLMVDHDKTRGWQGLDIISEELRNIPKLEGRKWKAYALALKEQRAAICHVAAIYKAQKPEFIE